MNRLGEEITNKYGSSMKIIEYNSPYDITVEFKDGYKEIGRYDTFKRKSILHWSDKFILGVGYKGEGKYKIKEGGKDTFLYTEWHSMLSRCYNENQQLTNKNSSYKGCTVCEEWHNFQSFAKWYDENFYEIEGDNMRLDKDILNKNNNIYSPENCLIVPERINLILCYRKSTKKHLSSGGNKEK